MSYLKGASDESLQSLTIGQLLEQSLNRYANQTAISYYNGQRLTYTEVFEKVDTLAAAYLKLGLKRGDHVAIWGFNTVQWYLSYLAGFRAGLVMVNLNPLHEGLEILECLTISDAKALIMDEQLSDRKFYNVLKTVIPEIEQYDYNALVMFEKVPLLKIIIMFTDERYKGTFKWRDLFTMVTKDEIQQIKHNQLKISTFDVCTMLFTSGTTGMPKNAMLTHHSLLNNSYYLAKRIGLFDKDHRVCVPIPFFHAYGVVAGILANLHSGATVIVPYVKFSPNKLINCIIEEKCTVICGTPTIYIDLLTVSQERAISNPQIYDEMNCVERLLSASSTCLSQIIIKLRILFKNSTFLSAYGCTETSGVVLMTQVEDSENLVQIITGKVMPHVEAKVVDENNKLVPLGTPGEICFRGYTIMKGYYQDEKKTKEVLHGGWYHSGDLSILMENGCFQVSGRIKDIINRGGEKIQSKEVEELLIQHPEIISVQVYGINDTRLGEAVAAAIVKKPDSKLTDQEVKEYCQHKIANYKIPQYVIFVEKFPKNAVGKTLKSKLKQITETYLKEKRLLL